LRAAVASGVPAAADGSAEHIGHAEAHAMPAGVEDDPVVVAHRDEDNVIPPALQEHMASRAGAHITRVKAGHLSLVTRPADVVKVILAAVSATT